MEYAYADLERKERIKPTRGAKAFCPCCLEPVTAKCGSIIIHHWAHDSLKECDSWSENEGPWHRNFKQIFSEDCQEVTIGKHRADIKTSDGWVIELQHSPISVEEIADREMFYGNMVWILDGTEKKIVHLGEDLYSKGKENYRIYHPRPSWIAMKKQKFIAIDEGQLIHVKEMRQWGSRQYITGEPINILDFLNRHIPIQDVNPKHWSNQYLKKVID